MRTTMQTPGMFRMPAQRKCLISHDSQLLPDLPRASTPVIAQSRDMSLFLFEFPHDLELPRGVGIAAKFAVCVAKIEMSRRVIRTKLRCAFELHDRLLRPILSQHHLTCQCVSGREARIS